MMVPFARGTTLRWSYAALGAAALVWYARVYRPADEALAARAAEVSAREQRVQSARAAMVVVGPAGLDSLLEGFRRDSALLATRIPAAAAEATVASEVKEALSGAERRFGVRITGSEPLQVASEGPFRAGGYSVRVVGRYADVGALLAHVSQLPRLTRVRALRLHAVPDSLVRSASPYGGSGAHAQERPDSSGAAAALADAGEAPFLAVASFHLMWFTLPGASSDTVGQSSQEGAGGAR